MATKVKENEEAETERETSADGPLLDLSDDAVKKMIKAAKKRGYVTMDELNEVLPSDQVDPDRIEDVMSMLNEMGINVVEDEDAEEVAAPAEEEDSDSDGESEGGELATSSGGTALATAKRKNPPTVPTIRCGCICVKWALSSFCRAKAKLRLPSASKLAARP